MKLEISAQPLSHLKADLVVLLVDKEKSLCSPTLKDLKTACDRYVKDLKQKKMNQELVIYPSPVKQFMACYLYAPSLVKYFSLGEAIKIAADRAMKFAEQMGYKRVLFLLNTAEGAHHAAHIAEAALLGRYQFKKYKSGNDSKGELSTVVLAVNEPAIAAARKDVSFTTRVCDSVNDCRDIVNEPPDKMYPEAVARYARTLARTAGLACQVLSKQQLMRKGYNGILSVGRGSQYPPCMVILQYKPRKSKTGQENKHLCLIGKGVTYDTGGACLKPAASMWEMKSDMSGAAAVIHAMAAITSLKPGFPVTAIAPLAQNAIDAKSYLPGEIIKTPSGKTVHVLNTDAEGRLLLIDALHHARSLKTSHIIDVATLTGSMIRALGTSITGYFANQQKFGDLIAKSGSEMGEDMWEMPLYDEYRKEIKSKVADIDNIGSSPNAGAITAALFLSEFVPEKVAWAHLDIAGTAFITKSWKYYSYGATGCPVKTLVNLCRNFPEGV